jgi:preprotein translocase subunit SecE
MAVADVEKVEKVAKAARGDGGGTGDGGGPGGGRPGPLGWLPRKIAELRTFMAEVRSELKKSTWPSRQEVYSTTLVVIATSVFFGFYLWGLDLVFSRVLSVVLKR